MDYTGKWKFHSIGTWDDDGNAVYMNAEEYINSPMQYIDETDSEAVAEELNERKKMTGMKVKICNDGNLYVLMPVPEGASKTELEAFLEESGMKLIDGMLSDKPIKWKMINGELMINMGISGEGENGESLVKAIDDEGYFVFFTTRFEKE